MTDSLSVDCKICGETLWAHSAQYLEWQHGMCRACYAKKLVTDMFLDARKNQARKKK